MKIIVLGGTGFIGRHICEKLAAAGHDITVPTRNANSTKALRMLPGLHLRECDVHQSAQLSAAVAGHDGLINLVAVLHGSEARFEQVHVQLPRRIAAACQAAGVRRVVHISALGAALDAPSRYLRSKARGEAALANSGLSLAMLRPSVVFGAEDKLLNVFAALQKLAPIVPLAGADTQFQPVWVEDLAQAVVTLATDSSYSNNSSLRPGDKDIAAKTPLNTSIVEACGPQVLTLRDLFAIAGQCVGARRPILPLPMPLARLQAWVMEHLPGEPLMSRDNLDSMQSPSIATGHYPGLGAVGISPSSIYAIAPTYLGVARTMDAHRKNASIG
ncbi:MAG: complex I NDUFA9 subunit family protein [Burkholderiaceae bacterium]